jgi:drug/metabolite transporter (DMT)-like permease
MKDSPPSAAPSPLAIRACIAVMCLVWGSTWIVIRGGLEDLPPYTSAAARFVVAAIAMAVITAALGSRESGARPRPLLWIALGTCNFAVSYGIVYRTETVLPSGLVSLLWGVFPMLMAISGHLFLPGERLRRAQWLGFGAGLVGLVLLFGTDLQDFGAEGVPAALVLFLSPLVSVAGNTVVKRYGAGTNSMALNRNAMALGAVQLSIVALACEPVADVQWTPRALATVAYLALAGTVLTFGLYFWLMRYISAHRLSLIAYVTPVIALVLGWASGEPITPYTLAGAACILGGVALVVTSRKS